MIHRLLNLSDLTKSVDR
jgi:hypothetical protein